MEAAEGASLAGSGDVNITRGLERIPGERGLIEFDEVGGDHGDPSTEGIGGIHVLQQGAGRVVVAVDNIRNQGGITGVAVAVSGLRVPGREGELGQDLRGALKGEEEGLELVTVVWGNNRVKRPRKDVVAVIGQVGHRVNGSRSSIYY